MMGVSCLANAQAEIKVRKSLLPWTASVRAMILGGGVLVIDRMMMAHELAQGALVELMPDYAPRPGQPIYAVYPARNGLTMKTATVVAFLQERLFSQQAL